MPAWTAAEDAILERAWADDTIASPLAVAAAAITCRTAAAIQMRASLLGFPAQRTARRKALGLKRSMAPRGEGPRPRDALQPSQSAAASAVRAPSVSPTPAKPRSGPCDRGEREIIRRRLVAAVIPTFARELGREPAAVADAILTIAKDGYRSHTFGAADPFATPREAPKTGKR